MGRSAPRSPEVDAYIAAAPAAVRSRLLAVRRAIRSVAPDATEQLSYRMAGYGYPVAGSKRMFAWFGRRQGHIGLYLRPPTIEDHRRELRGFATTMSAVHLPLDDEIPTALVRTLVRYSVGVMRTKERAATRRRARRRTGS